MPPKKSKGKNKVVRRKKVTMATPLPRMPTGYNRDIPMGGPGSSSNLLANIASMRPPPPAMPIQTPDQFTILREQQRVARVIDLVEEEQKAVRRALNKDGTPDMRYGANRNVPSMPLYEAPLGQNIKQEPMSQVPEAAFESAAMSANIRMTKKGVADKRYKSQIQPPGFTAPPVVGTGPLFPDGAPQMQQGLSMALVGKLNGAPPDPSTSLVGLEPIGDADGQYGAASNMSYSGGF